MDNREPLFERFIAGWMRAISMHASNGFSRRMADSGVTVAEWVVLRTMYELNAAAPPSEVAVHTGFSRSAISRLVDRAIKKGLISRSESTDDRRFQSIELTPKARALVPDLIQVGQENDDEFFACLTENERKAFLNSLKKIAQANGIFEFPSS